jgi:quinol monooxygenase YgiN
MQDEIYSLFHLSIDPSDFDAFTELIQLIVAATRKEADTSIYEYLVNADHTEVHIIERYRTQSLLPHVEQTFAPFADRFLRLARIERVFVYGDTTPEIWAKRDGFGAV